jgi:hypothetical protein
MKIRIGRGPPTGSAISGPTGVTGRVTAKISRRHGRARHPRPHHARVLSTACPRTGNCGGGSPHHHPGRAEDIHVRSSDPLLKNEQFRARDGFSGVIGVHDVDDAVAPAV